MAAPRRYTARELAEHLSGYGDLPVALTITDPDGTERDVFCQIQPLLTADDQGNRCVALVAYTPDEESTDA